MRASMESVLARIDDGHGQAGALQDAGQFGFIATGRLNDDQIDAEWLQDRGQRRMDVGIIVETLSVQTGAQQSDIDVDFGHIDANRDEGRSRHDRRIPCLYMRTRRCRGA